MMPESLSELIASVPFEDHHVHAPFRERGALSVDAFRRPFTESPHDGTWKKHLGSQIAYRWMVRELAGLLGVEPSEEQVLSRRAEIAVNDYHRILAGDANLGESYADDLFAASESYTVEEWSNLLGNRTIRRVLRIETFTELGYDECPTLDDALHRLGSEIESARQRGIVSLKSIAGYRTGLDFDPPSSQQRDAAASAYLKLRESSMSGGSGRIADKALVDTLVWTALEASTSQGLPMQFHVAIGDDDIVLTRNDPSLMRALFQHEPFRDIPLVLLHCYPFHRQAGYMASIYPNAYVDLGLTIPMVGPGATRIIQEALELTPVSQLLASTDGHMTPEFQWFGIRVWRWALARVFEEFIQGGIVDRQEAGEYSGAILRDNARRIYPRLSSD